MSEFAQRFRKKIGEVQRIKANQITSGACEDISEYRGRCGVLIGLEIALLEFEDMLREDNLETEDY